MSIKQRKINIEPRIKHTQHIYILYIFKIYTSIKDRRRKSDDVMPCIPAVDLWIGEVWEGETSVASWFTVKFDNYEANNNLNLLFFFVRQRLVESKSTLYDLTPKALSQKIKGYWEKYLVKLQVNNNNNKTLCAYESKELRIEQLTACVSCST